MTGITNESEFRQAIKELDYDRQRVLAAKFVEHVLGLSTDRRIADVLRTAADSNASQDELAGALHAARASAIDTHTRCGSEGDWQEQAGYFVARAAVSAVTPESKLAGASSALQAAMSSRMAQTCQSIAAADDMAVQEAQDQYRILSEYIAS
jgi:DNA-binding LacI/PurR family transcriptional regulator